MHFLVLLAFIATAHARAVNISNTWVLPEEGFPVFYRYFRDRISWYEADAVCQFHHANLVTVDTTAQYDAVRAYLKELDISSAVWVGLIRSNPEGEFTWTDYRGLSGDGYWSSAPDPRIAPLCAAADPISDYRWEARACGGPTVASFICELPVPQWALGKEGCMVRALPALTILYLPESAAVQLTADCGLAGVKRIQCTGNVKREELLRDLSCVEEEELMNTSNNASMISTTADITTVNENQESSTAIITEGNTNLEVENDYINNSTTTMISVKSNLKEDIEKTTLSDSQTTPEPVLDKNINILTEENNNLDDIQNNNLLSNNIPNLVNNDHFLTNYRIQKMEDEENMQHKKLHEELARLGNFETIFTQPTDHFVPPLVIAKAKLSDDMNVLSLEEKHAQYFGAHNGLKHSNERNIVEEINKKSLISTEQPKDVTKLILSVSSTEKTVTLKDIQKDKSILPKKYIQSDFEMKIPNVVKSKTKKFNKQNIIKEIPNQSNHFITEKTLNVGSITSTTEKAKDFDGIQNDGVIDLTVTLREIENKEVENITAKSEIDKNMTGEYIQSTENIISPELLFHNNTEKPMSTHQETLKYESNNDTVTSINFIDTSTLSDITTKTPVFKDELDDTLTTNAVYNDLHNETYDKSVDLTTETSHIELSSMITNEIQHPVFNATTSTTTFVNLNFNKTENTPVITPSHTEASTVSSNKPIFDDISITMTPIMNEVINITEHMEAIDNNSGDLETIDDFHSPLLSAANEPLQRPNRSRRPKQPLNRINKFNPFRILG